jgi:CO dehydrogenase maturation factor
LPYVVAVAGKGGTGKTTLAALFIRYLSEKPGRRPILAVDADPNSNLHEALGFQVDQTIADLLEETKAERPLPAGMTKSQFIQYRLQSALIEGEKADLLSMGAPEGPGCYCYPNDLLRGHMAELGKNYDYLVLDNEAGLEHLSRRVAQDVDYLVVTSDATARGVRSAGRVGELIRDLKTEVGRIGLVITKVRAADEMTALAAEIDRTGLALIGTVPYDENVVRFDLEGKPLAALPAGSPSVKAAYEIAVKIGL